MLVNRWGILRRAFPATMGLRKQNGLVYALCKLHNFCIDKRLSSNGPLRRSLFSDDSQFLLPVRTANDEVSLAGQGATTLHTTDEILTHGLSTTVL